MNRWQEIWNKKKDNIEKKESLFETFIDMKKANGFDIQQKEGYYEALFEQFEELLKITEEMAGSIKSVYEVGCGSGVNLFMFAELLHLKKLGGCDYSNELSAIAKKFVVSDDITNDEAINITSGNKYDLVLSDSVFQYFQSEEYGYKVMEKCLTRQIKS